MKHLPLFTAFLLVALIGAWNVSTFVEPPGDVVSAAEPFGTRGPARGAPGSAVLEAPESLAPVTEVGVRQGTPTQDHRRADDGAPGGPGATGGPERGPPDRELDSDGRLLASGPRVDGLRSGWWRLFWPGGALKCEGEYAAGARVGEWAFWREDGTLRARGVYVDGDRDGWWVEWLEDGRVALRAQYADGELDGLWERTYSNGQIRERGHYERGLREGAWEFYDFAGRVDKRTGEYERGRRLD